MVVSVGGSAWPWSLLPREAICRECACFVVGSSFGLPDAEFDSRAIG